MLFKAIIAGVMTLAVIGTAGQIIFPPKPILFYNPSYSAQVGWYRLQPDEPVTLGAQVAAYAPEWARQLADERGYLPYDYPLIKTVWAVHGDKVCYNTQSVSVPKRPDIPVLGQDVLVLKSGEYLLISPDVQTGFDSRYFGPVHSENILGVVEYLEESKNLKSSEKPNLVGSEG